MVTSTTSVCRSLSFPYQWWRLCKCCWLVDIAGSNAAYSNAVNAVPSVGVALVQFIQMFVGILKQIYLVGFNLGAQVIGFNLYNKRWSTKRYWTKLSLYKIVIFLKRQRSSYACYVDVIYADGDRIFTIDLGILISRSSNTQSQPT